MARILLTNAWVHMLLCISVGVALLIAVLLFRLFFSNLAEFVEAFYRPDFSTLKLVIWAALVVSMGISAYHTLPRHIPIFARHRDPKAPATNDATSKPIVAQSRNSSTPLTNSVPTTPPPAAAVPFGVKLGDTVQISAIHPPVALRSAVITSMDETQLTVRATSGAYTIFWKDLTGLKTASSKTTH